MKILIDARLYGLENTGIGRYTMNLVNNLKEVDNVNQYVILLKEKYYEELKFPSNWTKVKANFPHYSFGEQIILPFLAYVHKPDLTHFVHFNVPVIFPGKYIVTIHDLLMHEQKGFNATTLSKGAYLIKRLGYSIVFRSAVLNSQKIIAPSNFVKNKIISNYKINTNKISVIYEGVDPLPTSSSKVLNKYGLSGEKYFIYTGNAYPHKNLGRAIEAISVVNSNLKEKIYFCIVSARSYFTKKLEKEITKLGAKDFVKILGFVPDNDLGSLYKNSIAFLYPTLSEGFGLPGLEALNSNTLVLASNISVLKEVYGDSAIYFDPIDIGSIVNSIEKALSMESVERQKIISKAKEFIKKYSWIKMTEQTLKLYKSIR